MDLANESSIYKRLTSAIILGLIGSTVIFLPIGAVDGNDKDMIQNRQCVEESAAPEFLTCHDLSKLDIIGHENRTALEGIKHKPHHSRLLASQCNNSNCCSLDVEQGFENSHF